MISKKLAVELINYASSTGADFVVSGVKGINSYSYEDWKRETNF